MQTNNMNKKYLIIEVCLLILLFLSILGNILLLASNSGLKSMIEENREEIDSLNQTINDLSTKSNDEPVNPQVIDPAPQPTTKEFEGTRFKISFTYPSSFGEPVIEYDSFLAIESVTFTNSPLTIFYPRSEGGFDEEGFDLEAVMSKNGREFGIYTPRATQPVTGVIPGFYAFGTGAAPSTRVKMYAKLEAETMEEDIATYRAIVKSMVADLAEK